MNAVSAVNSIGPVGFRATLTTPRYNQEGVGVLESAAATTLQTLGARRMIVSAAPSSSNPGLSIKTGLIPPDSNAASAPPEASDSNCRNSTAASTSSATSSQAR